MAHNWVLLTNHSRTSCSTETGEMPWWGVWSIGGEMPGKSTRWSGQLVLDRVPKVLDVLVASGWPVAEGNLSLPIYHSVALMPLWG